MSTSVWLTVTFYLEQFIQSEGSYILRIVHIKIYELPIPAGVEKKEKVQYQPQETKELPKGHQ